MNSYENEPIVVQRDVKAVAIPAGVEVNLKLGSVGYITQALGGSFTVYIDGNLFRIAGQEADAIGKTAAVAPDVPPVAHANVELVFDPPWNHTMMSEEARLQTGMM